MKVFVIHYKKLTERKAHMLEQFRQYNITDYEFVEIDRSEVDHLNTSYFDRSQLDNAQIAIWLSHYHCYKEIAEKYKNALILEDDAILSDDFVNRFNAYTTQLPYNYDMLFIGDGCNFHISKHLIIPGKYIYEKGLYPEHGGSDGISRCTDSYLVSNSCAIQIVQYMENLNVKIYRAVDWWINIIAREYKFKAYWMEPTIVTQGTQSGVYNTSHHY